jgi:gamma-glutamyltranspeptidase/glutathione hydrolase
MFSTARSVFAGIGAAVCIFAPAVLPRVVTAQKADQRPGNVEIATFPREWTYSPGSSAPFASNGMVASNCAPATEAGVEILRAGGNAVDAAVAVGFALAVAYPEAGNLGGGGYAVVHMADGKSAALDFREVAPSAASADMYIGSDGKPTDQSLVGHRASGVPGSVAGLLALLENYGTMSRSQVMAPAIRLARDGFVVDRIFQTSVGENADLIRRFAGEALFLPDGRPPAVGSRFAQRDLAGTLEKIEADGADGFYKGGVAGAIAAEMKRGGGLVTAGDLAAYKPVWRKPLEGSYRGHRVLAMPPSSSGGVTVLETLNILETYNPPAQWNSALELHRLASAFERAFVDRNSSLGDPAFVDNPVEKMTSKEYARSLREGIDDNRATPASELRPLKGEENETTNFCVVDRAGNAVTITTTLNSLYGSGVWIPGAGFFMNDEMDDFTVQPGTPNQFGLVQGRTNEIAPGKRMLSAMAPTILLDRTGKVWMLVGGRGGPRIITAVVQAIVNAVDYRMTLADAIGAPRIHNQALPDVLEYEKGGVPADVVKALEARGWKTRPGGTGSLTAVERAVGRDGAVGWEGMFDPRKHGLARGY